MNLVKSCNLFSQNSKIDIVNLAAVERPVEATLVESWSV